MQATQATTWRLTRHDGTVLAHALRLERNGHVSGHAHPNESRWQLRDGHLHLMTREGRSSCVFDRALDDRPGQVRLEGRFCLDGDSDIRHVLEQTELSPEVAARVPELVAFDRLALRLRASPRVRAVLARHQVHFGRGERLHDDDVLEFGINARIEPYVGFAVGHRLCSMGSFSYAETSLDTDIVVGRYCSIASGVSALRDRHPMEWATTSSISYDFDPASGYRHFVSAQHDFVGAHARPLTYERQLERAPTIGHDVWIGQHAMLARGINVGHGAVIAAGAVVTKDVPPYAVVAGVPARIVRMRFADDVVRKLLASCWWDHGPDVVARFDVRDPKLFAESVLAAKAGLEAHAPQALTRQILLDEVAADNA
jgi:acetyltransferase-like isoleucine patch superfamily enzyme